MAQNYKLSLVEDQSDPQPDYLKLSGEDGYLLLNEEFNPPTSDFNYVGVGVQDSTRRGGI
jgi:hypothetical protein